MADDQLTLRQLAVLLSAVVYWGGVIIHARRIRRRIGKSPNIIPGNFKEILLWLGWFFVIAGWAGQPLIIERYNSVFVLSFISFFSYPGGILLGIAIMLCGYAGTLWCYSALGDTWRIGVNKSENTVLIRQGPYRLIRHPIYLFQIIILIGMIFLLPTPFSFLIAVVHFTCVLIKAIDEEAHLALACGREYHDYFSQTGRFLPRRKKKTY